MNPVVINVSLKTLIAVQAIFGELVQFIHEIRPMEDFMDKKALIMDDYFKGNIPTLEEAINKI